MRWLMRLLGVERHEKQTLLADEIDRRVLAARAVVEEARRVRAETQREHNRLTVVLWDARDRIGATEGGDQ